MRVTTGPRRLLSLLELRNTQLSTAVNARTKTQRKANSCIYVNFRNRTQRLTFVLKIQPFAKWLIFTLTALTCLSPLHASTAEQRPLCLRIEQGWTLAFWPNGAVLIQRTESHEDRAFSASHMFNYISILKKIKEAKQKRYTTHLWIEFYFGEFDRPNVEEIAQTESIVRILAEVQTLFLNSNDKKIRSLLKKYPIYIR